MDWGVFVELIGTVFVGALTVSLAALGGWVVLDRRERFGEWARKIGLLPEEPVRVITLVLICFGLGVFAEGVTDYQTDTESKLSNFVSDRQTSLLGTEGEHRFRTLFAPVEEGDKETHRLNGLGKAVFSHRDVLSTLCANALFLDDPVAFVRADASEIDLHRSVGSSWKTDLSAAENVLRAAKGYVNAFYYAAKNWCYAQPTYFRELERLQLRIDWARSSFLVQSWAAFAGAVWLIGTLLVLGFVRVIALAGPPRPAPEDARLLAAVRARLCNGGIERYLTRGFGRLAVLTPLVLPVAAVSCFSYRFAEQQFNERALGYWISSLDEDTWRSHASRSPSDRRVSSLLWMRTSAEYHALCLQTYRTALAAVVARSETPRAGQLPPAVILDLDETVFDTTAFTADLALRREPYAERAWRAWVVSTGNAAPLVPGAREFVKELRARGIAAIYVSNRAEILRDPTRSALRAHGLWDESLGEDQLFLRTTSDGKDARRKEVAGRHEVLALVGDNLADFSADFEASRSASPDDRVGAVADHESRWGDEWFVLPNPVYGDWETLIEPREVRRHLEDVP
jgi:5'-nucleotidase (lipoprotein e(P4) family)